MSVFCVIKCQDYCHWISARNIGLFVQPFVLSYFMYWLSSSILPFSYGNPIPEKCSVLHTFSWDVSLISVLKEWRQFKQQKQPWYSS